VVGRCAVATFTTLVRRRRVLVAAHAVRLVLVADEFVVVAPRTEFRSNESGGRSRR
jgi:hypothetical protein